MSWNAVDGAEQYDVSVGGSSKSATGTSASFSGLTPGETFTVTVIAVDANGQKSGAATTEVTTEQATPELTVSAGEYKPIGSCNTPGCKQVMVKGTDFEPNASLTCKAYNQPVEGAESYPDFQPFEVTSDENGNFGPLQAGVFGFPRYDVWVTCGEVESDHITWP